MRYFKDSNDEIFAYDQSQTPKDNLTEISEEELDSLISAKKQSALDSRTQQEKIRDLEGLVTQRNIRSAMLGDQWAIDHITSIENQIAALRSNA